MAGDKHVWVAYRYDPSLVAAVIFTVLFFLISFLHLYQLLRTRTWVFIPFVIGGLFESVGYIGRILSSQQSPNWTQGPYIMQTLLILVAPALFAASTYMVLGRIILVTDGESHSLVRAKWLTKIFVAGDVLSFATQGGGGGIMAGSGANSFTLGEHIIDVGLIIQIVVFSLFVAVASVFHWRMHKAPTTKVMSGDIPWQKHLIVLYASSALILIRSIFRLGEYLQGNDGILLSSEWYLYVFDATLMFAVMVLFAWIHPSEIYAILKGGGHKAVRRAVSVYSLHHQQV